MLDPAPRVFLDSDLGMCLVGRRMRDAEIANDIYRHTIDIILRATALGGYRALPPQDIFDVEYWDLEQAKVRKGGVAPVFAGEIGLVTGAVSDIGKACVEALLSRGAAVVALDIDPVIAETFGRSDVLGLRCDVTDRNDLGQALDTAVNHFGGLDMLVLNAGIVPPNRPAALLSIEDWGHVMRVSMDAGLALLREAYPLLQGAPRGGRVVVIGSENISGQSAASSATATALTQLARVAALEWGSDGIRVNVLGPHTVFNGELWTPNVPRQRTKHDGVSGEDYGTNNVLESVEELIDRHAILEV